MLVLPHRRGIYAPSVAAMEGYPTASSDYDGTNDYLTRGAELDGISDGDAGTFSAWLRIDGGDGANRKILANDTSSTTVGLEVSMTTGNLFVVRGRSSLDVNTLLFASVNAYAASAAWIHVLASWDASAGAAHLYINDADDYNTATDIVLGGSLDYTQGNWSVGAWTNGTTLFNGCISELLFHATYLDITVEANRRKFRNAHGRPVSLGADGSLPLGVQPLVYLRDGGATNLGSGGNFTVNGSLDVGSTAP